MTGIPARTHFLYPSTIFASRDLYHVTTILGSCVAVCFWDPITKAGAINHYMLPLWNGQGLASPKFGNIAIKKTIEKMLSFGCNIINIKAKVFGGGEILETKSTPFNIGFRNVEIAQNLLDEYNIPIISASTGGNKGRKILFNTNTGEVKHKFILATNASQISNYLSTSLNLIINDEKN